MLPGDVYYYSANSCVLCVKRGQLKKVTKPPGLNPNANIFTSSKLVATPAEKDWETREEFLTNGDLKQDEVGGGFSSGDSPVSTSPPVQVLDSTSGGPQVVAGGTGLGGPSVAAYVHMVTVDAAAPSPAEDEDACVPVILPTMQMPNGLNSMGHEGVSVQPAPVEGSVSPDRLRALLKQQLEYYFSRENLVHDQYLQSQMDSDQYVPIATVASFNLVQKLTHDLDLIVEVLRASKQVQVDEKGEKVRPKHSRSVLMLREIPETTPVEEVRALFDGENCPKVVSCEFAHNSYWYITFETDEDATQAYRYLREEKKTFLNKPIMARIKARPLMRTGGPYMLGKAVPRQPAPEAQNFLRQQPAYPIVTPISTFVGGQPVAQPFYLPPVMPQWGTPTTPTFLDPGAMLAMNGYQATSIKPSTNNNRNMYPMRNNRGPKPHHRSQVASEKNLEQRSLDRSHNSSTNSSSSMSTARASPRNSASNNSTLETLSHSVPFSRARSEGLATSNHNQGHAHSHPASASSSASHIEEGPSPAAGSAKSEQMSTGQKRGGNYRRRRNDDGGRSSRNHQNHQNKDGKAQHELSFELEPLSFPPLPGQLGNSCSSDTPEGNKLSDVVKGTARQGSRSHALVEKDTKPASLVLTSLSGAQCAPLASGQSSTVVHSVSSDSAISQSPAIASVSSASLHAPAAVVSASSSVGAKETVEPSVAPASYVRTSSSTNVTAEPSPQPRTAKTSSATTGSMTPTETTTLSKQAAVNSSAVKHSAASVSQEVPARLSYAQMVQRKQVADGGEKQKTDDPSLQPAINASVTRPSAQTTLREQSQTQTVNAITASATPKSACASVRSWNKEPARKDYEPREQRFQSSRRSKENRDRQQRPERRCSEREVRVVAK